MALTWLLQVLSLSFLLNADRCGGAVPPCRSDWFGSPCRYKCHCENNNCDNNGECTGSSTCVSGWFGPACQYVDLVATNTASTTPAWVYDSPDTQCNTGHDAVTVTLQSTSYFTWLRLRVKPKGTFTAFGIQLISSDGRSIDCTNMHTTAVSDTVLDIHCDTDAWYQQLTITGDGAKLLCAVYISGGRNVALGQDTVQTSVYYGMYSWKAVDGDRNSDYDHGSCTHTAEDDKNPTWTLTFQRPHQVIRYNLYNRNAHADRLRGFTLEAYQKSGSTAFSYTDKTSNTIDIYRIQSQAPQILVSSVKINTRGEIDQMLLTLCEVEMFGEVVCPVGKYGSECEHDCHCAGPGESCFVSTGVCPSGCAAGYQGETCSDPCSATYYGDKCALQCSSNCKDQLCDSVDGNCQSCVAGKTGQLCDQVCSATFYGDQCALRCSLNCTDQNCNSENGHCQACVPGKTGQLCDKACSATYYGDKCALQCSSNCKDQLCDPVDGNCQSCVAGKTGQLCDQVCSATFYGDQCALRCSLNCTDQNCNSENGHCQACVPGKTGQLCDKVLQVQPHNDAPVPLAAIVGPVVAVVIMVTLIVIGVHIWRRRRHKRGATTQASFQDDVDIESTTNNAKAQVVAKYNTSVNVQANPQVMKKPKLRRASKDGQESQVGGDYCYIMSCRSKTAFRFTELEIFMAEHRKEFYQEQFNLITANSSATTTVALSAENQNKNRYKNINAYDHSRVHLQIDPVKLYGDYINASYVDGYQQKRQFIASQGPTKIILEDFVRMLWEQEVQVVVMLTNLIEDGKLKCEQYWPNDGEINIGEVTVKLETTQVFADYTVRRLCLYKTSEPVQMLTHFHLTTWPDKDVSTAAWGLVDLEKRVASIATSRPIVVHCSAGVGRTGTFIALHNILEEIKHTGYLDVFTTVQKLRQDRMHMVHTSDHYRLLYQVLDVFKKTNNEYSNLT